MVVKGYSKFPKAAAILEHNHHIGWCHNQDTLSLCSYPSAEKQSVHSTVPTEFIIWYYFYINLFIRVRYTFKQMNNFYFIFVFKDSSLISLIPAFYIYFTIPIKWFFSLWNQSGRYIRVLNMRITVTQPSCNLVTNNWTLLLCMSEYMSFLRYTHLVSKQYKVNVYSL